MRVSDQMRARLNSHQLSSLFGPGVPLLVVSTSTSAGGHASLAQQWILNVQKNRVPLTLKTLIISTRAGIFSYLKL